LAGQIRVRSDQGSKLYVKKFGRCSRRPYKNTRSFGAVREGKVADVDGSSDEFDYIVIASILIISVTCPTYMNSCVSRTSRGTSLRKFKLQRS
jgi:hypothetical protein